MNIMIVISRVQEEFSLVAFAGFTGDSWFYVEKILNIKYYIGSTNRGGR